jgi:hypothetical protein
MNTILNVIFVNTTETLYSNLFVYIQLISFELISKMVFSIEERELKFRQFIKLRAKGTSKSVILRSVGKKLNLDNKILLNKFQCGYKF